MDPVLSIVTIAKNSEKTIRDCIMSVITQKSPEVEYILIDGNSTDQTMKIIYEFKDQIDSILSENDKGISDAFNKGVSLAKGRYIAFMNSDDYYLPGVIQKLLGIIKEDETEYSQEKLKIYYGDLELRKGNEKLILKPKDLRLFRYRLPVYHLSTIVPLSLMKQFPFSLAIKIAMDYDSISKMYHIKTSFKYIPMAIASMGDQGISHKNAVSGFREVMTISRENLNISRLESFIAYQLKVIKTRINENLSKPA